MKDILRKIPPIHELQKDKRYINVVQKWNLAEHQVTKYLSKIIDDCRNQIVLGDWKEALPGTEGFIVHLFYLLDSKIESDFSYKLKRVINATGTVLHTNLGRSRLSKKAVEHVIDIASNYSNLEFNLAEGTRGSRHSHLEKLITDLTGAEAALVVNNNAAAVYLVLKALAKEKEVIVSRGQLVEIGGSFRVSSIMEESGAILKEVGTTNKTHTRDYKNAITEKTALVMKVHTSNFKMIGFTKEVETMELVELLNQHEDLILYEDLGSGVLYDFTAHGIGEEPIVKKVIESGVDLVSFSGDKLLGGPQAGIIAGRKEIIDQLKQHQLARVLRVDKMTIAALEATLMEYSSSNIKPPIVRDLLVSKEELVDKAKFLQLEIEQKLAGFQSAVIPTTSAVGGGTMPGIEIDSVAVSLTAERMSTSDLKQRLRLSDPPVIVRVQRDVVLIDVRTIEMEEIPIIIDVLSSLA